LLKKHEVKMQETDQLTPLTLIDPTRFYHMDPNQKNCGPDPELLRYKIEHNSKYPEIQYLLRFNGVGCFPAGDLIGLSGKAKSGKGLFTLFLLAALLRAEYGGFEAQMKYIKALIIDTEQTGYSAQNNLFKVYSLCGWDKGAPSPRFNYYSLRDADIKTRRTTLENALIEHSPNVVILDGIRDLIMDFNSIAESAEVVNFLMRLTKQYNVTIVCVLHTNKADANLRGHLGAELINKGSEVYNVTKDGHTFKVTQTECRNAPIEDWAFSLDELGLPIPAELERKINRPDATEFKKLSSFDYVFAQKDNYKFTDLVSTYREHMSIGCIKQMGDSTARRHISAAVESGIIEMAKDKTYILKK